jgi:hypothetical protein
LAEKNFSSTEYSWFKRNPAEKLLLQRRLNIEEYGYLDLVEDVSYTLGGHLSMNGAAPTLEEEAALLGISVADHSRLLDQMLKHLLLERDSVGRLFSPVLQHQLKLRAARAAAGRQGGFKSQRKRQQAEDEGPQIGYGKWNTRNQ